MFSAPRSCQYLPISSILHQCYDFRSPNELLK
ncbi:hypothetical protein Nmel_003186 [Mimus melanotis]